MAESRPEKGNRPAGSRTRGGLFHLDFETVGSISAMVVGLAALVVSWDQSRLMREEIRASVWPALQVDGFVTRDGDTIATGLRIENAGIGPALLENIAIRHRGDLVPDIEAMDALMPEGADRSQTLVTNRILAAGDEIQPLTYAYRTASEHDAVEIMQAMRRDWRIEICYCSALDQCWVTDDTSLRPREVNGCRGRQGSDL